MRRVWDYIGFAVSFAGFGYIVLWLIGSPDHLVLSPGLHWLGVTAAGLTPLRLAWCLINRRRVRASAGCAARAPAAVLRPPRRAPSPPLPTVKPRRQFGLRGAPD